EGGPPRRQPTASLSINCQKNQKPGDSHSGWIMKWGKVTAHCRARRRDRLVVHDSLVQPSICGAWRFSSYGVYKHKLHSRGILTSPRASQVQDNVGALLR